MRYLLQGLFGERSLTKLAAVFPTEITARETARRMAADAGLAPGQIRVLGPDAARLSRRSLLSAAEEPEPSGIWRTLLRAHVVLGALGAVAGWAVCMGFMAAGNPAVTNSPRASMAVIAALGLVFGLLAGGLVALRPDHAQLFASIRSSLESGSWVVIAHPLNARQTAQASEIIVAAGRQVLRTF